MIKTPLSVSDLYIGSILFAVVLVFFISFVTSTPLVIFLATVLPIGLITVRLVLLSKEYTEETLVSVSDSVYTIFIVLGLITSSVVYIVTNNIGLAIMSICLFTVTTLPLWMLDRLVGDSYRAISFGFRESLSYTELWKGATVCMQNARKTNSRLVKSFWYWLASHRFKQLTRQLDSDTTYSNKHIAHRYWKTTVELSHRFFPYTPRPESLTYEYELDEILLDFTQMTCKRCNMLHPISELYLLTENGVVSEVYCEDCVKTPDSSIDAREARTMAGHTPNTEADADSETKTTSKQETGEFQSTEQSQSSTSTSASSSQEQSRDRREQSHRTDLEIAMDVFDISSDEVEEITAGELRDIYRDLVKETHPDSGGDEDDFKIVVESHKRLQEYVD